MITQTVALDSVNVRYDAYCTIEVRFATLTIDDATGQEVAPRAYHRLTIQPVVFEEGAARAVDPSGIENAEISAIAAAVWKPEVIAAATTVVEAAEAARSASAEVVS